MRVGMGARIMRVRIRMDFVSLTLRRLWRAALIHGIAASYVCDDVMSTSSPHIHSSNDISICPSPSEGLFFKRGVNFCRHTVQLCGMLSCGTPRYVIWSLLPQKYEACRVLNYQIIQLDFWSKLPTSRLLVPQFIPKVYSVARMIGDNRRTYN